MSVFNPGEVQPQDTTGANGSQKQGRSILSYFAVSTALLTLHPVCLMAFPTPSLLSIFHCSLADFLLFSFQTLTNGWKVGVPFKKSTPSAPKGGVKADGQVRSFSIQGCVLYIQQYMCVFIWGSVHIKCHISNQQSSVSGFPLDNECQCVSVKRSPRQKAQM